MSGLKEFDDLFLSIVKDLKDNVITTTEQAAVSILAMAEGFLDERSKKTVQNFHELYFADIDQKEAVNREVDDLIDSIQQKIDEGNESNLDEVEESEEMKKSRLTIAALQKELETIIQLDTGIKDKLIPVLSGMQFEDLLRKRVNNIYECWGIVINCVHDADATSAQAIEKLEALLQSNRERSSFYNLVRNEEYNESNDAEETWLDFGT